MEKEFIPYEQALALKELGFESPYPIGGYQGGKIFYYEKGELYYDGQPMYSSNYHDGQLLAPLYQQAFRWFREKYGFNISITSDGYVALDMKKSQPYIDEADSYEEAELECLKELIKIVKNK